MPKNDVRFLRIHPFLIAWPQLLISAAMIGCIPSVLFAWQTTPQNLEEIRAAIEGIKTQSGSPAIWAGVVRHQHPTLVVADGVRKHGENVLVTDEDLIHLGSCTKAMTSLLAARLVERGDLDWTDTIEQRLPKLSKEIHESFRKVTLEQLLSHRSGMPANASNWRSHSRLADVRETRYQIAKENLHQPPVNVPGSEFLYSNLGYMVAGMMIEAVTDCSWEQSIRTEVFEPLGMTSASFGAPGDRKRIDQPWGHIKTTNWVFLHRDNAAALGPAGTVHCSMQDWGKFIQVFFSEDHSDFLKPETMKRLVTPFKNDSAEYALGWGVFSRDWAEGEAYSHSGSNTMWYCVAWVAPQRQVAFLAATNGMQDSTPQDLDRVMQALIQWHQKNFLSK